MNKATAPSEKKVERKEEGKEKNSEPLIAIIRIRGESGVRGVTEDTMQMLHLKKKFNCFVVRKTPAIAGMLQIIKDYVTWGEISAVSEEALKKRNKQNRKFIALMPPRGGFERKGTKMQFGRGGALGYRGAKIDELISRMV
jgi:large subunit ribosomal protein L30